ncbi:MAG: CRISPR-associated helicase Cas3', partial [Chloroflexota bacterium]
PEWNATIQTGEQPQDPLFEGKLVFATVDQMLASFLNVPYGVPKRQDNINAGAFIGSYLIFDEFHLYPSQEMLLSVLAMCHMLKGVSRFTLMTATFSRELLTAVEVALDAKLIADTSGVPVTEGLFSDIKHLGTQQRQWQAADGPLTAADVRGALADHDTVLCVLNRVDRAQEVYAELMDAPLPDDVDVVLLHSRFYREHRASKEQHVLNWLGKREIGQRPTDGRRKIVIATQVVEVGLDISADTLLMECAPAASLIQRAGRCVRWGGAGVVRVFQPPNHDMDHKHYAGQPNYTPYEDDGLRDVCERTWAALSSSDFDGRIMQYHDEQRLINRAHTAHDQEHLVDGLEKRIDARVAEMTKCMQTRDQGMISSLIREQSGVPLYIMANLKDPTLEERPHDLESFNVSQGRIARAFDEMMDADVEADFWFGAGNDVDADDSDDAQTKAITKWNGINKDQVYEEYRFVAHPQAVYYDSEIGLEWVNLTDKLAQSSPLKARQDHKHYTYNRDTLAEHVAGLRCAYDVKAGIQRKHPTLRDEYAYALARTAAKLDPSITFKQIDRYIRLMIALHDIGKLNRPWQQWAEAHQRLFKDYNPTSDGWDGTPLAHTDTDFANWEDKEPFRRAFAKQHKQPRGPHAVESAEA